MALEDRPTVLMEHLSERARTGVRARGTQLGMEDQKTLALMSRVVDMGLETVDIAMERKKMKAASVKLGGRVAELSLAVGSIPILRPPRFRNYAD